MRSLQAALASLGVQAAEAPLSAVKVLERAAKTPLIEVRPQAITEMQFGKR
jgi:hypothetical protein